MREQRGPRWWRRAAPALAAVASAGLVAASATVGAGPAQAEVVPWPVQVGEQWSLTDDSNPKVAQSSCVYSDGVVVAVGARIMDAWGNATVEDMYPTANLRSSYVRAYENGEPNDWHVIADAICARGLTNPRRVESAWSARDSQPFKTALAVCPSNTKLYGLGAQIDNGLGNVFIGSMVPTTDLSRASVIAYENGAYAGNWAVKAYAVCAAPAATMTVTTSTSVSNSDSPKNQLNTAPCPSGTIKYGFGGAISSTGRGSVVLETITMRDNGAGDPFASEAQGDENGAFGLNWSVTTYAICATPPY